MEDNNVLLKLSKSLFWDYNINELDPDIDKNLILERVFTCGTEDDEREVFNYYGKNVIKDSDIFKNYFLVGGTALAKQRITRLSEKNL